MSCEKIYLGYSEAKAILVRFLFSRIANRASSTISRSLKRGQFKLIVVGDDKVM